MTGQAGDISKGKRFKQINPLKKLPLLVTEPMPNNVRRSDILCHPTMTVNHVLGEIDHSDDHSLSLHPKQNVFSKRHDIDGRKVRSRLAHDEEMKGEAECPSSMTKLKSVSDNHSTSDIRMDQRNMSGTQSRPTQTYLGHLLKIPLEYEVYEDSMPASQCRWTLLSFPSNRPGYPIIMVTSPEAKVMFPNDLTYYPDDDYTDDDDDSE